MNEKTNVVKYDRIYNRKSGENILFISPSEPMCITKRNRKLQDILIENGAFISKANIFTQY